MSSQDLVNQLFNGNSKAFGAATEQQYQAGTYKRGEVFLTQAKRLIGKQKAFILDYGCGTGRISMMLGKEGYTVLGLDPAQEHIEIANGLNEYQNVRFSALENGLKELEVSCDMVVSSSVLEFVPDVEQYIQDINTVLKPGGLLLVSIPNLFSLWRMYSKIRFGKRYKHFEFQQNLFSQKQLKVLLEKHHFNSVGSGIYFESAFDQKGLSVLNKSMFFGTLVLLTFVKK